MKNNQSPIDRHLQDAERKFTETKFAKGGGSSFECSDFEGMYNDLKSHLSTSHSDLLLAVVEEIEGMKKPEAIWPHQPYSLLEEKQKFNAALSAVQDTLKKYIK